MFAIVKPLKGITIPLQTSRVVEILLTGRIANSTALEGPKTVENSELRCLHVPALCSYILLAKLLYSQLEPR